MNDLADRSPAPQRLPIDDEFLRTPLPLPTLGRPRRPVHVFERESVLAVNTALACGRPLLVRGEPGAGKSQLARAVAAVMHRVFVSKFVDARTEAHDLLWVHDAVARLAEAQAMAQPKVQPTSAQSKADVTSPSEALALARFVVPGPLWWALHWTSAKEHVEKVASVTVTPPRYEAPCDPVNGVVLLIDEIDKADGSVPNGLLEALGQGTFDVPGLGAPIEASGPPPLVLLTTNEDRVLPDAFVRRCVVLHLDLPPLEPTVEPKRPGLIEWLVERGKAHFGDELTSEIYGQAADRLAAYRVGSGRRQHRCPPGLAEYIDLLTALADQHPAARGKHLDDIAKFLLDKHADPRSKARR